MHEVSPISCGCFSNAQSQQQKNQTAYKETGKHGSIKQNSGKNDPPERQIYELSYRKFKVI